MNGKYFVDTNILVYAHDPDTGIKHIRAKEIIAQLWDSGGGVLSTQVLQELCVNVRRKSSFAFSIDETSRLLRTYLKWKIVVNDGASIMRALELETRFKLSFWDALILQAAESAEVDVLLSEDFSGGQSYGSVRVENPFATIM
jgi:predicted nucleic acid-binding protein